MSESEEGTKASFKQSLFLFIYHVVLALFLAYAIYNVWPPQPWPENPQKNATAKRPGDKSADAEKKVNGPETKGTSNTTATATSGTATGTIATNTTGTAMNTTATNTTATATSGTATNTATADARSDSKTAGDELSSYGGEFPPSFSLFGRRFQPPLETRLILLVLLVGAMGSYVHAASSFVDYLGNRAFISSWGWWYLLRPFIGMMLALLFYFVFRGGFVTAGINQGGDAAASFINPFGIAALAGLVGMFSKVAADKLNEVFVTLFRPASGEGDAKRDNKIDSGAVPVISGINPNVGAAAGGTAVAIKGTGFVDGIRVTFGGVPATAVVIAADAASLTAVTPAHAAGVVDVEATNPNKKTGALKGGFTYQ